MTANNLKTPPSSSESEQSLIAAILQNGKTEQVIREAMDSITPEMFYYATNREIYEACLSLKVVDFGLVIDEMETRSKAINRPFDLNDVVQYKRAYSSLQSVKSHAHKIAEAYTQRQLAAIAYEISEQAISKQKPESIIEYIQAQLSDLQLPSSYELRHIADCMGDYFDTLQKRAEGDESVKGVMTGIEDLDSQINGLGRSWLFVLAGRPSHGKSLVAQIIGNHISRTRPTIFFSMEMEETEILDRLICLETGILDIELRKGQLLDSDFGKVQNLVRDIKNRKLNQYIDTTPNLSLQQIRVRAKKFKKAHPNAGLIQIDYLGLMKTTAADRHDLAIGELTRGIKSLAKEIQIPIMLLVQCNRAADTQKRLKMSNLADAAAIERDADLVMFTHRDEVNEPGTNTGIIELTPGKFRHGTFTSDVYLKKDGGRYSCVKSDQVQKDSSTKKSSGFDIKGSN